MPYIIEISLRSEHHRDIYIVINNQSISVPSRVKSINSV